MGFSATTSEITDVNEITKRAVDRVLSEYDGKQAAKLFMSGMEREFLAKVQGALNESLVIEQGIDLKARAISLMAAYAPGAILEDNSPVSYELDCQLSYIVERTMQRRIDQDKALQLDLTSVIPYLEAKLHPQTSFFEALHVF